MAKALQCPRCRHKHRLDSLPGTPTFRCERCGQSLKTPATYLPGAASGPPDAAVAAATRPVHAVGETAVLPSVSAAQPVPAAAPAAPAGAGPPPAHHPMATLPLRIGAWVVAVPAGLFVVAIVADVLGFVTKDRLIQMFRSANPLHYLRLLALVPFWALVTATIAQVLIEGSRWLMARRNAASSARTAASATTQRPGRTDRRSATS